jgi:hypothetical protein
MCGLFSELFELFFQRKSVNRVYSSMESTRPVYGSIEFIKPWPSITGSEVQIKLVKGYALVLISCAGSLMNDHELIR